MGQVGKCPKCGSDKLDYQHTILDSDMIGYKFFCEECHISGVEWYNLVYTETIVEEGDKHE